MYKETVPKSFMTREISNIIDERLYEIRAIASFYQTIGSHGDDVSLALLMGILKISDIKSLVPAKIVGSAMRLALSTISPALLQPLTGRCAMPMKTRVNPAPIGITASAQHFFTIPFTVSV